MLVGNVGRLIITDIWLSLRLVMIASPLRRAAWLHTRQLVMWQHLSCRQRTRYASVSLSTSRCSTLRSSTLQTELASWQRVHSMTQLPSWTRWARRVTATRPWSCSCCETIWHCGPPTCKQRVCLSVLFMSTALIKYAVDCLAECFFTHIKVLNAWKRNVDSVYIYASFIPSVTQAVLCTLSYRIVLFCSAKDGSLVTGTPAPLPVARPSVPMSVSDIL